MHKSVMEFVKANLSPVEVLNQEVLEVGSKIYNGSVREFINSLKPHCYLGIDMENGDGVDQVMDVTDIERLLGKRAFDLVISTEMLEHCKEWKEAIYNMKSVLRPGGKIILTTRSPGYPLHEYPFDHWRFTRSDMVNIFDDFYIRTLDDTQAQGVFVVGVKPHDWVPNNLDNYEVERVGGKE